MNEWASLPENIFKDVDLIYLDKECGHGVTVDAFLGSYSEFLHSTFEVKESAVNWTVLRRR